MWLLKTATAELQYFTSPEKVPRPGYAILSHVWRENEQSFQEVKAIGEACKLSGENPRDKVSEKIRRCCEVAEGEGYEWRGMEKRESLWGKGRGSGEFIVVDENSEL